MPVGEVEQRVDRAGQNHDVRVQHQVVVRGNGGHAPVAAAPVTDVLGVADPAHVGKTVLQLVQPGRRARVVDHDHLVIARRRLLAQRLEAPPEVGRGVVVDDDDAEPGCQISPQEMRFRRSAQTIQVASQMIRRDILLTPTSRSTNMMGISLMRNPRFQTW